MSVTTLHRTVSTTAKPESVLPYLVDFENAAEWDSGTVTCDRIAGDGGVGTRYRNRSSFAGRTVELDYVVEQLSDDGMVIVGRNATATSRDTITVRPSADGSTVDYLAEFSFSGIAGLLAPVLRPFLNRLGDRTAQQLEQCLDRLL